MNLLVILCAFAVFVSADREIIELSPPFLRSVEPHIKKCRAETNAPEDAFDKMLIGVIEDDASLKFNYCYLLVANFIDKESKLIADNVTRLLKNEGVKDSLKSFLEDCNSKATGKDHLEVLSAVFKCYKEGSPVHFKASIKV